MRHIQQERGRAGSNLISATIKNIRETPTPTIKANLKQKNSWQESEEDADDNNMPVLHITSYTARKMQSWLQFNLGIKENYDGRSQEVPYQGHFGTENELRMNVYRNVRTFLLPK